MLFLLINKKNQLTKKQKKMKKGLFVAIFVGVTSVIIVSCKDAKKKDVIVDEVVVVEEMEPAIELNTVWVVEEHKINDVPLTSKATIKAKEKKEAAKVEDAAAEEAIIEEAIVEEAYEIATIEAVSEDLAMLDYEAHQVAEVDEYIIPIDETQTLTSYNKKGTEKAELQVVSSGVDNEVQQIIFTDKKHKDVYDVGVGMTGKEVRKLRREMKHMLKHGKVFLYNDDSNVMYLMDAKDYVGDDVAEGEVENMGVSAIIWKDKKHHKKNK